MDRPHGLPRWVALLLLFTVMAALAAVSMVPRGMLRAVAIHEVGSPPPSGDVARDGPAQLDRSDRVGDELPGVRAVIKREERETGAVEVLIAVLRGPAHVHPIDESDGPVLAVDAPAHRSDPGTPADSRGPPSPY